MNTRPQIVHHVVAAMIVGSSLLACPGSSSAFGAHRHHVRVLRQRWDARRFMERGTRPASAPQVKAMEPSPPPVELLFATEFTDGGTYCANLRYATGEEVAFCIASPDAPSVMFAANRIYIGARHPIQPNARLVPHGSDEESRLMKSLETAMAPYLTAEGKQARENLPDKKAFLGRYWQLQCAEGMLRRLHEVVGKERWPAEPDTDQARASAEIQKGGGVVRLDETRPGKPAISVDLNKTEVTDAGLEYLVKNLTQLQQLELGFTKVTDAGLGHLKGLTQLRLLGLACTYVTDAGLEHLKGCTKLQTLWLGFTKVTDAGVKRLKGLTRLELLDLGGTKVTDAGLQHLNGLTQLRSLWLWHTQVTDAGLAHLKGLTQLRDLYLSSTKVTDAGLEHLKGLSQLQKLHLEGTKVTDAGVRKLQQALPNCKIHR